MPLGAKSMFVTGRNAELLFIELGKMACTIEATRHGNLDRFYVGLQQQSRIFET